MAFIGMRRVVVARIAEHTEGQVPTYEEGRVIGKAIRGNLTITRNNNPLFADDAIAEDDNGITAMSLEMGTDDMEEDDRVYAMGLTEKKDGAEDGVTEYLDSDEGSPYVGVGYLRVRRRAGKTTYQGLWYYKATLSEENEESETKGESIQWKTPSIRARMAAIAVDESGKHYFRKKADFPTEAKAVAWMNKQANIPSAAKLSAQPSAAVATTGAKSDK